MSACRHLAGGTPFYFLWSGLSFSRQSFSHDACSTASGDRVNVSEQVAEVSPSLPTTPIATTIPGASNEAAGRFAVGVVGGRRRERRAPLGDTKTAGDE